MASQEQIQQLIDGLQQKDQQINQLMQQLQTQNANMQQMQQSHDQNLHRMQQQHEATMQAMQSTLQQTFESVASSSRSSKSLVDNKGIGKPNNFDSDMKKWSNFSFKFKNFVSSVFRSARALMDWAEEQQH
eukprot:5459415-Pyramimonas_sp.AAC.1